MQEQTPPTPPAPPVSPAPVAAPAPGAVVVSGGGGAIASAKPADLYAALRAQRRVLVEQLDALEDQRGEVTGRLESRENPPGAVERQGLEQRLVATDARIAEVGQQIAASEREIARVAGIPGAAVEPPQPRNNDDDDEAVAMIGVVFTIFVLFPLAFAHARRIWRRSAKVVMAVPGEITERFNRLEQAVDSVAIEVERVAEGQRFVTKILTESRAADPQLPAALGAGPAQPVEIKAQPGAPAYRSGRG